MAKIVLTDCFVSVAGTDISDHVRSLAIEYSADAVEDTTMGAGTHTFLGGLKNWSISVDIANDFAGSAEDSLLFPLVGTAPALVFRPTSAAVGSSNPQFTCTGLLTSYPPLSASVGDLAESSIEFVPGGASPTLARATS